MKKIGVIVDSTSSLSDEYIKEKNIGVAHFKYTLDGLTYSEGIDETAEEYSKRLRGSKDMPKTSQPPIGDYLKLYDNYTKLYDKILVLPLSKGLSGSYQSAVLASEEFENVRVLDTCNALDSTRFMVERIFRLINEGLDANEIGDIIERDRVFPNYSALLVANELIYLEKGGRIPPKLGQVGDFIKLKPIININARGDGKLAVTEVSRGSKRTINRIVELIPKDTVRVAVGHVNNPDVYQELMDKVRKRFPEIEITDATVSPVIASHIGPNCYGLFYTRI